MVSWQRMRPELLWVGVMRNMRKDFSFLLFKKTNSSSYASMPQSSSGHTQVDYCWIKEVYRALIGWMLQCEPEEQVSGNSKLVTDLIEYFSVVFRSFSCLKNVMKRLILWWLTIHFLGLKSDSYNLLTIFTLVVWSYMSLGFGSLVTLVLVDKTSTPIWRFF